MPQPLPPREDLYMKEPIKLGPRSTFTIPFLPDGKFDLMAPESLRIKTSKPGEPEQSVRLKETAYTSTEWRVSADGTRLERDYKFTEKQVSMHVLFEAHLDYVDFKLTLKNDSADTKKELRHFTCQGCGSPYFYNHELTTTYIVTDAGPQRLIDCVNFDRAHPLFPGWEIVPAGPARTPGAVVARFPFVCTVSADGKWVRAVASPVANSGASNGNYCCLHLNNNQWMELKPGEDNTSLIRYYFLRGGVAEALARYKADFEK